MEKIGSGTNRNVYNFGENYVLKIAKFDIKLFFEYLLKNKGKESLKFIIHKCSGILENLNERKNSKMTDLISEVKFSIPGILNIQEKCKSINGVYYYNDLLVKGEEIYEQIHSFFPEIKYIYEKMENEKLTKNELSKDERYLLTVEGDILHSLVREGDYGIDKHGNLVIVDGGNKLLGKILKETGKEFFKLIIQEGTWEDYWKKKYPGISEDTLKKICS